MSFPLRRRLPSRALAPGRYVTDGRRLLRVLSRFDDGRSVMVLVEDCRTFATHAYAVLELRAMGFRGLRRVPRDHGAGAATVESPAARLERSGRAPA
jgi:hypothetical protein